MVKLYSDIGSPMSRAVHAFLNINNIVVEIVDIELFDLFSRKPVDEHYLEICPLRTLPCLEDGDCVITDTVSILIYLAAENGLEDPWYPIDLFARARVDRFLHWQHSTIWKVITKQAARKIWLPMFGVEVDEAELSENDEKTPGILKTIDSWIAEYGYVASFNMTIADLIAYTQLDQTIKILGFNLGLYPNLDAWRNKMAAIPAMKPLEQKIDGVVAMFAPSVIHGYFASWRVQALIVFCKAAGIKHEFHQIDRINDEQKGIEHTWLNPEQTFPILTQGNFVLSETVAILQYLAESKNLEDQWYPAEPKQRALIDQYLNWFYLEVGEVHSDLFRQGTVFPVYGKPITQWKLDNATKQYPASIAKIEKILEKQEFLGGSQVSIADFNTISCINQHKHMKFDQTPYPKLKEWQEKMLQVPGVGEYLEEIDEKFSQLLSNSTA